MLKDYQLCQCLFGEHLLINQPNKPVGIVESEKTAIIASAYLPELTWMAAGSLNGINVQLLSSLSGKSIVLYPDIKGYEKWERKAHELKAQGFKIAVSDILEKADFVTEEDRTKGYDLADYLPLLPVSDTDLQRLIKRNPSIELLVRRFDLTVL